MALDALDPLNVRRTLGSLASARRALLPLPYVDRRPDGDLDVFPPAPRRPAHALRGERVAVVGSAGGAECVALVGMARAFEELGVKPAAIAACSWSVPWAAMWAAGLSSQEMANRALSWRPEDELGIQWIGLPRLALSALRGFGGLVTAEALECLFDRRTWHMAAGETPIPLHTAVYNLDRGRIEYFGSAHTPELRVSELVRIAVAPPVRVEGELYADGGAVDAFPAEPLISDGGFDFAFGLDAAPRSEDAAVVELARRSRTRLGERLSLVEPISRDEVRGPGFYELFLDRRRWRELMLRGYEATVEQLRKEAA